MNLDQVLQGWRWEGADGAALARAFEQSEAAGRGILFAGTVGSGKTTAARLLTAAHGGLMVDCGHPERVEALADWRGWAMPSLAIMLDELGRDAVRVEFGNRRDVVALFLREVYAAWKAGEWTGRLYATTNLSWEALVRAYDESVADRLAELCVPCRFTQGRRVAASEARAEERPQEGRRTEPAAQDGGEEARFDEASADYRAAWWWPRAHHGMGADRDALRVLRVNLGAFSGEDCERFRALRVTGAAPKLSRFIDEAFAFGCCASPEEARRWATGVRNYVATAYAATPAARAFFNPENAEIFDGWHIPFDFKAMREAWEEICGADLKMKHEG